MDQDRIVMHYRFNGTLRIWLAILGKSQSSTPKKWINKKKHLTINNIKKIIFWKRSIVCSIPSKDI